MKLRPRAIDVTRAQPFDDTFLRLLFRRLIDASLASSLALAPACAQITRLDNANHGGPQTQDSGVVQYDPADANAGAADGGYRVGRTDAGGHWGMQDGGITTQLPPVLVPADNIAWPDGDGGNSGFMIVGCPNGGGLPGLGGLHPSEAFDSMELHHLVWLQGASAIDNLIEQVGQACKSAGDAAACQAELPKAVSALDAACTADATGLPPACGDKLVTTGANGVKTWDLDSQLLQLLGTIDTPQEAAWVAQRSALAQGFSACMYAPYGSVRPVQGGYQVVLYKIDSVCGASTTTTSRSLYFVSQSGEVKLITSEVVSQQTGLPICGTGRKPEGFVASAPSMARNSNSNALGDFLATCAQLESVSIDAFEILADELQHHGAPTELVALARQAAADEVRHASLMTQLANAHHSHVQTPVITRAAPRSLEAIAIENAVEGCVGETYGALVATYQAEHAQEPQLAAALAEIAVDETKHAQLSWRLSAWLDTRLPPDAQERVAQVRARAFATLRDQLATAGDPSLYTLGGMPRPELAQALCQSLESALAGGGLVPCWS